MTTAITTFVAAALPSLFVGLVLAYMNKKSDRRYEEEKEKAKERAESAQIQMEMITAAASLSYACAMALKRADASHFNGELENAVTEYALARKKFGDYLVEVAGKERTE